MSLAFQAFPPARLPPHAGCIMSAEGKASPKGGNESEYLRQMNLVKRGSFLSAAKVRQLEGQVAQNPEDFDSRIMLLGAYFLLLDAPSRHARYKHVLWIIEHRPDSPIAGTPYAHIDPVRDGEERFETGKRLWKRQIRQNALDVAVLSNAADFFTIYREEIARKYLEKCIQLDPANCKWPHSLGLIYLRDCREGTQDGNALLALRYLEEAMKLASRQEERDSILNYAAEAAFNSGNYEKARDYAAEELQKAGHRSYWNYGNAVHNGNAMLGRVALKEGDIVKAKEYLLAAGDTPGSPQLNSFGPDMSLANDLLKQGEKETVITYLTSCCRFWKKPVLEGWIAKILSGRTPVLDRFRQ